MKSFSISQLSSLFAFVNEKLKNILCYMSTQFYLFEDKLETKSAKIVNFSKFFLKALYFHAIPSLVLITQPPIYQLPRTFNLLPSFTCTRRV